MAVEGTDMELWGMEVDVDAAKEELRALGTAGADGSSKVDAFMSSVGLGAVQDQLKDLRLSAPTPPPPSPSYSHPLTGYNKLQK